MSMENKETKARSAIQARMRGAQVISFDIFDTLLGRVVSSPMDVFDLVRPDVEEIVGHRLPDFVALRRRSEANAKAHAKDTFGKDEVTLREIYDQMALLIGMSEEQIERGMAAEMAWERQCLIPRRAGQHLFEMARSTHKDIILVSDMYLPKDFLEDVLRENGFDGWVKFYLSAEQGVTKTSGKIFDVVLDDFRCEPERILHVGDNPVGDIKVPKSIGIQVYHIPRTMERFRTAFSFTRSTHGNLVRTGRTMSTSVAMQAVADAIFPGQDLSGTTAFDGDVVRFGYATMGPLVAGFSRWLESEAKARGVDRLLFLSRDGQVLHRGFQEMCADSEIETDYVLSSRRIINISNMTTDWDIIQAVEKPIFAQSFARYAYHRFGLGIDQLDRAVLRSHGISDPDQMIGASTDREPLKAAILEHRDQVFEAARRQRELYQSYLAQYIEPGVKVGLVDIGYAGTMQAGITQMFPEADIFGFYVACNEGAVRAGLRPSRVAGYVQDKSSDGLNPSGITTHRFAVETMICSAEDSFEGFDPTANGWEPLRSDVGAENRKRFVRLAHTGALRFCKELKERWPLGDRDFYLGGKEAMELLVNFLKAPSTADVEVVANVEFEDNYATQHRRVLISSGRTDGRIKTLEIWKEGVAVRDRAKAKVEAPVQTAQAVGLVAGPTVLEATQSVVGALERGVIRLFCSESKRRKHERKRDAFFLDSRVPGADLYYRATFRLRPL
jgi:FMN phosphatase YigB (HAD superfamily)